MSLRVRGQEVKVKITIDGSPKGGSWLKLINWKVRPKTDYKEEEYLGEDAEDFDIQHSGYEFTFDVHVQDDEVIRYVQELADREAAGLRPQQVTMTVIHNFRERSQVVADNYYDVLLICSETGAGGRKEYVGASFEGRCKKKNVVRAA